MTMLTFKVRRFVRSECFERQRMNFATHPIAQRRIYHSMPHERQLAGERCRDHSGLEMYAVRPMHIDACAGQTLFDHILDGVSVHRKAGFWRAAGKAGVSAIVATAAARFPSYAPVLFNSMGFYRLQ